MMGESTLSRDLSTAASPSASAPSTEPSRSASQVESSQLDLLLSVYDTLLDWHMPPSILIDASRRVVDTFAGADRFLRFSSRRPSQDLVELLLEPFRGPVADGLALCASTGQVVLTPPIPIEDFDPSSGIPVPSAVKSGEESGESAAGPEPFWFRARISAVPHRACELPFFTITFEDAEASDRDSAKEQAVVPPSGDPVLGTGGAGTVGRGRRGYVAQSHSAPLQVREADMPQVGGVTLPASLASLFELNGLSLILLSSDLRIEHFSAPAAKMFGLLPHDIGREFRTFAGGLDSGDLLDRLVQAVRTGDEDEFEIHQEKLGLFHLVRINPLGDPPGSTGVALTLIDLSALENARRESRRLSEIVRSSADAIISRDVDDRIVTWNDAAEELYGFTASEAIGARIDLIIPEMNEEEVRHSVRVLRREPSVDHFEATRRTKAGDLVRVSVRLSPIFDENERVIGLASIERDISARAELVSKLSQSEQLLQAFYDRSPEMHCSIDLPSGLITDCNRSMEHKLGMSRTEIVGRSMLDLQSEASRGLAGLVLDQLRDSGMLHGEELELSRRDGTTIPISVCAMAIHGPDGQLIGSRSLWRDMSELRAKDELIRQGEARYREAFQNSAIGIAHCELDGRITLANKRLCDIVGYSFDELVGRPFADITLPEDLEKERPLRQQLLSGQQETYQLEKRYQHRNGHTVWVTVYVSMERDTAGKPLAFHKFIEDISARKELEHELRSAIQQRDQFLAMLSHELRNPLGAIVNTSAVLIRGRGLSKQLQAATQIVARQAKQMAELLDDLLDVSRITTGKIKLEKTPLSLNQIVDEAIESQNQPARDRNQTLTVTYADEPLHVFGDRSRLVQVVVNLLNNAIKYTGDGGRISVYLERKGRFGLIRVRDSGVGMEPGQIESLFEMFAQQDSTLDRSGGGMGLGLHLVRKLVEFHSGRVTGRSDGLGKGSEFVVELPLSTRKVPRDPRGIASIQAKSAQAKSKRIAVVEDIEDARKMLVALLEADDYQVSAAADGEEGLALILRERPDLAIVDIGLPKLDGYELARRVREVLPPSDLVLVALTGYGQESDHALVMEAGFDTHLVKPLNQVRLEKILARL